MWLIYVVALEADVLFSLKHADDTTFYKPLSDASNLDPIGGAIEKVTEWPTHSSMLLNPDESVMMNISLSNNSKFNNDILVNDVGITPSDQTKFIGVIVNDERHFSIHIDYPALKATVNFF